MRLVSKVCFVTVSTVLASACSEGPVTPDPSNVAFAISDALHGGGNEHFFWLSPMVGSPESFNGAFDEALSPVVRICDLADCGTHLIAEYTTTTGPGSETVRVVPEDEHYIVNWHTDEFEVAPGPTYRVSVVTADRELGYADVQLGSTGKEVKNLTTNEIIGLKDGRTLPVKFRIEGGIVGSVELTPSNALIADDETQAYTATVTDLHGVALAGATVEWTVSDAGVATLSPAVGTTNISGEHTSTATPAGTVDTPATVTATSQGVEASAVLEVEASSSAIFAYVANVDSDNVSVIDVSTNTVVGAPIPVGSGPIAIAITPDGTRAYVANVSSNNVSVIDLATRSVVGSPIPVGSGPIGIAITPDGRTAYVTNINAGTVSVIDLSTDTVVGSPIPVGTFPFGVAFNPSGTTAYVTNGGSNSVSVIDVATSAVVGPPIVDGLGPQYVAITPDGATAYVANTGSSGNVSVIDLSTNTPVLRIPTGNRPAATAITPDGSTAYVTHLVSNDVFVIDIATNSVIGSPIPVGAWPAGIAITPDGATAYVTNRNSHTVSVIDLATNMVIGSPISVGMKPFGIAITPSP